MTQNDSRKILTLLGGVLARQQVLGELLVEIGERSGLPPEQLDLAARFDAAERHLDAALEPILPKARARRKVSE
jgi:hypothetical protein